MFIGCAIIASLGLIGNSSLLADENSVVFLASSESSCMYLQALISCNKNIIRMSALKVEEMRLRQDLY